MAVEKRATDKQVQPMCEDLFLLYHQRPVSSLYICKGLQPL